MNSGNTYQDEHLAVDFDRRVVEVDHETVTLTDKEFELLAFLIHHAETIVSPAVLLTEVWAYSIEARTRTLDVHLSRVRRALSPYGEQYIERVFRAGCRFRPRQVTLRMSA